MGTLNEPETDFHPQNTTQESSSRVIAKSYPGLILPEPWSIVQVMWGQRDQLFFLAQSTLCLLTLERFWNHFSTTSQNTNIPHARFPSLGAIERANVSKQSAVHREIKLGKCCFLMSAGGCSECKHYLTFLGFVSSIVNNAKLCILKPLSYNVGYLQGEWRPWRPLSVWFPLSGA